MFAVCGGGVREGTMPLVQFSASFQSFPLLPTSKLGLSCADSQVGGFVYVLWPLWVSPMNSPVRLGVSPTASTLAGFSARSFESLFPLTETLSCMVCLTPQLFHLIYLHTNVGLPTTPATALLRWWVLSATPTGLDECFFFNSMVVGLPYRSIFWQFWLFFVFKFVVFFLLVVWGGKVYVPMYPSGLEVLLIFFLICIKRL